MGRSDAPPAPVTEEFCHAAAEGIYAAQSKLPAAVQEALERYLFTQRHTLDLTFEQHMPRAIKDPWIKAATVFVRFAILPDGSIDTPIITRSSGRRDYDNHALDAVRTAVPFAPLPEGIHRAQPVCMRFGYNVGAEPYPLDDWWRPKKPGL